MGPRMWIQAFSSLSCF